MQAMSSDTNHWVGLLFLFVVFPLWLAGMGRFLYFFAHVAPSALERWADGEGYQIIERKNPRFRDWRSMASNFGPERVYGKFYRVIVRDKMGQSREGLVLVGGPGWWYTISVRRCAAKVRWDGAKAFSPVTSHPENKHLMWDRELG
jgi:hypothetical protein